MIDANANAPAGNRGGGDGRGRRIIFQDDSALSSIRQALADLLWRAEHLAETDPNPERRARHRRLARYLAGRIARRVLRVLGRARLDVRGAVRPA